MTDSPTATTASYCPECSLPSIYVATIDRFVHVDGSPNVECWSNDTCRWVTAETGWADR